MVLWWCRSWKEIPSKNISNAQMLFPEVDNKLWWIFLEFHEFNVPSCYLVGKSLWMMTPAVFLIFFNPDFLPVSWQPLRSKIQSTFGIMMAVLEKSLYRLWHTFHLINSALLEVGHCHTTIQKSPSNTSLLSSLRWFGYASDHVNFRKIFTLAAKGSPFDL